MQRVFNTIDEILNNEICFNLENCIYEIIENIDVKLFNIQDIINYLENSSILRYDIEYDTTIIEIIGGYLLIRIDTNFNQIHLCYCRYYFVIPFALNLIC